MISAKHIKDSERKYVKYVNDKGGIAQRIAGSGCGKYSVCDVICLEDGYVFLDEVKSTKSDKLVITKDMRRQLEKLIDIALANPQVKARLVIHWKRRGFWQIELGHYAPKSPIKWQPVNSPPEDLTVWNQTIEGW